VLLLVYFQGIVSSIVLFFIPYGAFSHALSPSGMDNSDIQFFGVVVASILVVAVNLRVRHFYNLLLLQTYTHEQ